MKSHDGHASLVVGVVQLCAIGTKAVASMKKDFGGHLHGEGRCDEIQSACQSFAGVAEARVRAGSCSPFENAMKIA